MGYNWAGFDVVGVDIHPQPEYPFEFHQADALSFNLEDFDAIHASPPCQAYSTLRHLGGQKPHADLVDATRARLIASGVPYIIENVPGAPLINPVTLCGQYFGLKVRRHRLFETSFHVEQPKCDRSHKPRPIAVYGDHPQKSSTRINRAPTLKVGQRAMGIDWMSWTPLTQAIPPAYSHYLGRYLKRHLRERFLRLYGLLTPIASRAW
jgi:DNA (cytosine-5)-methyltransferase 1